MLDRFEFLKLYIKKKNLSSATLIGLSLLAKNQLQNIHLNSPFLQSQTKTDKKGGGEGNGAVCCEDWSPGILGQEPSSGLEKG